MQFNGNSKKISFSMKCFWMHRPLFRCGACTCRKLICCVYCFRLLAAPELHTCVLSMHLIAAVLHLSSQVCQFLFNQWLKIYDVTKKKITFTWTKQIINVIFVSVLKKRESFWVSINVMLFWTNSKSTSLNNALSLYLFSTIAMT